MNMPTQVVVYPDAVNLSQVAETPSILIHEGNHKSSDRVPRLNTEITTVARYPSGAPIRSILDLGPRNRDCKSFAFLTLLQFLI